MPNTYEKHDWEPHEVITEALLDHMEQGIYDANNKALQQVNHIIQNSEEVEDLIKKRTSNFLFSVDREEQTLIFEFAEQNAEQNSEINP